MYEMVQGHRLWTLVIAASAIVLAGTAWFIPTTDLEAHNILHHLNFLPLMAAGMLFGWRGALWATAFCALLHSPHLASVWNNAKADAKDQIIELAIFGTAGLIAGLLSDRERDQKFRVEKTKLELERVYTELQANIEQVKKSERLSAAGQLAASLAHEIRNPLASISGAAGIIGRGNASSGNLQQCLEIIQKESDRLNKLLSQFLEFARPRTPRFQTTDLKAVIQSVVTQLNAAQVKASLDIALPMVECDPEQIRQVLLNLLINAVQASGEGKSVDVGATYQDTYITVSIRDQGRGITSGERAHIFEPFFTTKERGTGLGLAIASKIVEQHDGTLVAEETPGGGATFSFALPLKRKTRI